MGVLLHIRAEFDSTQLEQCQCGGIKQQLAVIRWTVDIMQKSDLEHLVRYILTVIQRLFLSTGSDYAIDFTCFSGEAQSLTAQIRGRCNFTRECFKIKCSVLNSYLSLCSPVKQRFNRVLFIKKINKKYLVLGFVRLQSVQMLLLHDVCKHVQEIYPEDISYTLNFRGSVLHISPTNLLTISVKFRNAAYKEERDFVELWVRAL